MSGAQHAADLSPHQHTSSSHEPWPRGVSRDAVLSIGHVKDELQKEFPALTVSKIRYLETEGLISPVRNGSGYRKYSQADIERLRFVLVRQRDSYSPLKAIGDELAALDAGQEVEMPKVARIVASDGKVVSPTNRPHIPARELMDLTDTDEETLERYVKLGLLRPNMSGYFPMRAIYIVPMLLALESEGLDPRLLRSVQSSADRAADIVDASVANLRSRGRSGDKERASARAMELSEAMADLYREMLRNSIAQLNS